MIAVFSRANDGSRRVAVEEFFDLVLKWHDETHAFFVQLGTNAGYFFEVKIEDRQLVGKVGRLRNLATSRSRHCVFRPYLCQSLRRAPEHDGECWAWRYGQTKALLYSCVGEEGAISLLWQVAAPDEVKAAMPDDDASLFENGFL
ncbi:hypothetical protein [Paraburkholderia domus]|uniref:hypothetical protein n=1 Tax=Paraburkholderia domus TaxID=2793075 RepID=UPI001912E843|nr:hypothetical protein [Paraburkholderia domus]MBK5184260.1 hypothetical protein [Burkholderia sp. R-69749]CAE6871467.1 hypothetical protein R69749_06239 [Paraburkholderia domus]